MKRTWPALVDEVARRDLRRFDILGIGECSLDEVWRVERLPLRGEKISAAERVVLGGGQVATAMVAAARLGRKTAFAGAVGDDAAGELVRRGLVAEDVDGKHLQTVVGATTRTAAIFVDAAGERTIVESRDERLRVPPVALADARLVHVDATIDDALVDELIASDALLSIDVDVTSARAQKLVARADLVVISVVTARALVGTSDVARLHHRLATELPGVVVLTYGADGAEALDGETAHRVPGLPVEVVDTTACGDTFRGALLTALCEAQPLPTALAFANRAAALKCRALGRSGCPTRAEVLAG